MPEPVIIYRSGRSGKATMSQSRSGNFSHCLQRIKKSAIMFLCTDYDGEIIVVCALFTTV